MVLQWCLGFSKLVVYGPKGLGKSSDFRALACLTYQKLNTSAAEGPRGRVVFLWEETLVQDLVEALKNALLFSCLDEYSMYAQKCILGKIPARRSSIYFYTGFVPLFQELELEKEQQRTFRTSSVLVKKGVVLGGLKLRGAITLETFAVIPSRSIKSLLQLKPNSGFYYKPLDVCFPDVDDVVIWMDDKGELHIAALQCTVNIDEHLHSADQFMSLQPLKRWFPDVEEYVSRPLTESESVSQSSTDVEAASINLHFAFVGCSSRPGFTSGERESTLKMLTNAVLVGTPAYLMHILPLDGGLNADDYKVLVEITQRRTWPNRSNYTEVSDDVYPEPSSRRWLSETLESVIQVARSTRIKHC
ncbi:hypothetical protein SELMODRAFT_424552 [Selaginella moellendorffii]|uniref:Uncharacterized protein n=1 Tax=Selaginella moellendorffii TaxID=88036 RepID=D8SQA1_SELML|nr:hypothetical protein SELMODRAFT_424552 [Selaginella moellendorffii]